MTPKKSKSARKSSSIKTVKKPANKSGKHSTKSKHNKKGILFALLIIVILIAAALTYLLTNLNFIVKKAIEKYGSQSTQTAVHVAHVKIRLKDGAGSIQGLTVANPNGFAAPLAFSLGEIGVDIDIKSLTDDEIGIEDIVVREPEIFVEINADNKNNLNELMKNMPESNPKSQAPEVKKESKETPVFIRRILFKDGKIHAKIVSMNNEEYHVDLPSFEMHNLRGTPQEIARQIMTYISKQALKEIKKKGIEQAADKLRTKAKTILEDEKQKATDNLKNKLGL